MHIIYLAGNSLNNKSWIEKVKQSFNSFSTGDILYYDHWQTGEEWADLNIETEKLTKLVEGKKDYYIFCKSIGSVLALKCIYEKVIDPKKLIICGHPYPVAIKAGHPIDDYLKTLTVPTIFIQNEFDPLFSFDELEKLLKQSSPKNYSLIKNPSQNTHSYEDFDNLVKTTQDFFGK